MIPHLCPELISKIVIVKFCSVQVNILSSFQNGTEPVAAYRVDGMRHKLIVQLLIKNSFSAVLDHRTAAGNDSVKSDRIQLRVLYVSTAAPAAQERQMPVLPQAPDRFHRAFRNLIFQIPYRTVNIKKCSFLHPFSPLTSFAASSFLPVHAVCRTYSALCSLPDLPAGSKLFNQSQIRRQPFHTSDLLSCQPACRLMLLQHQTS